MSNTDSPLHIAVKNNSIDIAKMLLESQCDVHAVNAEGLTSLHLATQAGNTKMVALLLQHGGGQKSKSTPLTSGKSIPESDNVRNDSSNYAAYPFSSISIPPKRIARLMCFAMILFLILFLTPFLMMFLVDTSFGWPDQLTEVISLSRWIASLFLLITGIMMCALLYHSWAVIQGGNVRTTPGKAVGYCFIPLFNFIWIFTAIPGLVADMKNHRQRLGLTHVSPPNMGLAIAISIVSIFCLLIWFGPLILFWYNPEIWYDFATWYAIWYNPELQDFPETLGDFASWFASLILMLTLIFRVISTSLWGILWIPFGFSVSRFAEAVLASQPSPQPVSRGGPGEATNQVAAHGKALLGKILGRRRFAMIAGAVFLVLIGGWWMTGSNTSIIRESVCDDFQALELIGRRIEDGERYFQQNHAKRRSDWIVAAKRGIPEGQYLYGYCFRYGTGENQNNTEAFKWFRKAAEQGNVAAQHELGLCYNNGRGVAKDNTEAAKWFRKAAEQGDARSQFLLSTLYLIGEGVAKDNTEAAKWLCKAAEQGDAGYQYLFGMYCLQGMFGAKDEDEGIKWLLKAERQGNKAAKEFLDQFR